MIKFSVSINSLTGIIKKVEDTNRKNLLKALVVWHGELMRVMSGQRSGKEYQVPFTKKKYTASAPGEAPASRTGTSKSAYKYQVKTVAGEACGELGTPLLYPLFLEKGTSKMKPRPHLRPAFENKKDQIVGILTGRNVG